MIHTGKIRTKGWRQEALLRLLDNVLEVAEDRENLIVYAALGKAARNQKSYNKIVEALKGMEEDQTLIIQSGKPIGLLKTHKDAPLVIMANCNMVGRWATADNFYDLQEKDLICWGGLTAGAWQYIGTQGVIQGTYEIFMQIAKMHFNGDLKGKFILTAGLGGMGGAQPLAAYMANAVSITVEVDEDRIDKRIEVGYLEYKAKNLDEALALVAEHQKTKAPISIGLLGNAAEIYPKIRNKGIVPDIVTDQTSAHDLVYGYIPPGLSLSEVLKMRKKDPKGLIQKNLQAIAVHVQAMLDFQKAGAVVFDNGNLIRSQATEAGITNAFDIPVFTKAYLRPLFCQAIGPFRWIALSGNVEDLTAIDDYILEHFKNDERIVRWIQLAKNNMPIEGYPARIAWMGHGQRTALALAVNDMVRTGKITAPVAFSRDHLDAGGMTHPNIMTEGMKDGSDSIADWPLINAMTLCASKADLVVVHSGGGGYSGYMTSSGVTIVADGTKEAEERIKLGIGNDTSIGVMRYADAGYEEATEAIKKHGDITHFQL